MNELSDSAGDMGTRKESSPEESELQRAARRISETMTRQTQPFDGRLLPTEFDAKNVKIWKQADDPRVFVRESLLGDRQTVDTIEASIRNGERQFDQLRDRYTLRIVSMHVDRGRNEAGNETVFTTVDAIDGQNLGKLEALPAEAQPELDALYVSLAQHYSDAWKEGSTYWGDCRSDQFVYGSKHGERDKHFWVVDVDPEFYRPGEDRYQTIEANLGSLVHDLLENERKFSPPVRLQAARDKLLAVIDEILTKEPDSKLIAEARTWLLTSEA